MQTSVTVQPQHAPPTATEPTSRKPGVTGKVRRAIDAMVWLGLHRAAAAQHAGLAEHSLYQALRRPPVKAYYLALCEDLRLSGKARRIHRYTEINEQSDNLNAAVAAGKALDAIDGQDVSRSHSNAAQSPGFIINIVQTAPQQPRENRMVSGRGPQVIDVTRETDADMLPTPSTGSTTGST